MVYHDNNASWNLRMLLELVFFISYINLKHLQARLQNSNFVSDKSFLEYTVVQSFLWSDLTYMYNIKHYTRRAQPPDSFLKSLFCCSLPWRTFRRQCRTTRWSRSWVRVYNRAHWPPTTRSHSISNLKVSRNPQLHNPTPPPCTGTCRPHTWT